MFNQKLSHSATENKKNDLIVLAVRLATANTQLSTWPGMSFSTNTGSMTYNISSRTYMMSLFSVLVADFMRTSCSMFIVGVVILVALESELTTNVATCYSH